MVDYLKFDVVELYVVVILLCIKMIISDSGLFEIIV